MLQSGEKPVDGVAHRRKEIHEAAALEGRLFGCGRREHGATVDE
jgi:hypothetical protein